MIESFCKDPTSDNFYKLKENYQISLYHYSLYCIKKKRGRVDMARKVINYYLTKNSDRFGIKAILLASRLIREKEFTDIKGRLVPAIRVFLKGSKRCSFNITYSRELPDMYVVDQQNTKLGVDKNLSLYYDGLKEYIIDTFSTHPDLIVERIDLILKDGQTPKHFYKRGDGVRWDSEECLACLEQVKKGVKLSKRCHELVLVNRCADKIRYRMSGSNNNLAVITPKKAVSRSKTGKKAIKKILGNQNEKWECNDCSLLNDNDSNECIACGASKP